MRTSSPPRVRLLRASVLVGAVMSAGACSIVTDLSDLTRGTATSSGAGGATHSSGSAHGPSTSGEASSSSGVASGASSSNSGAMASSGAGGGTSTAASSSASSSSGGACNGVNEFQDPVTSHCYWYDLAGTLDRFSDARTKCKGWSPAGDLTVIENAEEAGFIFNTINVQKDTWIGLSDQAAPGVYQWVSGAALTGYTDWDVGFPNDMGGTNDCIAFAYTLKWQNAPCSSTRYTLCERP